jgi:hypothetical protein
MNHSQMTSNQNKIILSSSDGFTKASNKMIIPNHPARLTKTQTQYIDKERNGTFFESNKTKMGTNQLRGTHVDQDNKR